MILSLIAYLVFALCQEVDIIAQALNIKLIETVIIGLVIISLFIDILLTECIINEIKFYGFCAEDTKQKERNTVDKETPNRYNN